MLCHIFSIVFFSFPSHSIMSCVRIIVTFCRRQSDDYSTYSIRIITKKGHINCFIHIELLKTLPKIFGTVNNLRPTNMGLKMEFT